MNRNRRYTLSIQNYSNLQRNKPISRINDVIQETRIGLYSPINWLQALYAIVSRYQVTTIVNIGPCRSISLMLRETPLKLKVIEADKLLAGIS